MPSRRGFQPKRKGIVPAYRASFPSYKKAPPKRGCRLRDMAFPSLISMFSERFGSDHDLVAGHLICPRTTNEDPLHRCPPLASVRPGLWRTTGRDDVRTLFLVNHWRQLRLHFGADTDQKRHHDSGKC